MTADRPLVSVVMPLYNAVRHVGQAVSSVEAQTMSDWELLVVDDGSADGSERVVEEAAREDLRISLVRQGANKGAASVRNTSGLKR